MLFSVLKHHFTNHTTAILPDFGALIKTGNSYMYNEYLKYDDGKLTQSIEQLNSCTPDEAKRTLTEWIAEIINTLDKGDSFDLREIGKLVKTDDKISLLKTSSLPVDPEVAPPPSVSEKTTEKILEIVPSKKIINEPPTNSAQYTAVEAIAIIQEKNDKLDLIDFTRNENRKTVIDALNKKLALLNTGATAVKKSSTSFISSTSESVSEINEPIPDVSSITSTVSEKEDFEEVIEDTQKEIEALIQLTNPLVAEDERHVGNRHKESTTSTQEKDTPANALNPSTPTPTDDPELIIALGVEQLEKEEKARKKKRLLLIVGLLCILSGGGILGFLNKDYLISFLENKTEDVSETKSTVGTDISKENSQQESDLVKTSAEEPILDTVQKVIEIIEPEVEEIPEEISQPKEQPGTVSVDHSSITGDYLLIAGSFSVESNADNLVNKLKEEGFNSAHTNKSSGSLTKVVAGVYTTKDAANDALDLLIAKGNKGFVQKK
jgi:cell division septation protein DedD